MIESTTYQDSERYQNNISPEPSNLSLTNQCYKTPIYQNVNTLIQNSQIPLHSLYPTPPSDNEDSNHLTARLELDNTPKLTENYYFNSLAGNNSYQSKHAQNDVTNDDVSNESSQNASPTNQLPMNNNNNNNTNSNRYKRRSRTTYSKIQLDTLESTFQKTHYPEIRVVDELSSMLNLSTERISIWFQNRRARFKKARKLENNQELISQPTQFKPQTDSVYSATSYGLAASNYPSSSLDTNYLLSSIDKNPLKLLNHQLIAEKLNLNKYSPSVQETTNYGMLQTNNTFYQSHYPNIIPNEQNFYNHNSYQQLVRNDASPIANYSMTSANNLTYHQTSSIVQ